MGLTSSTRVGSPFSFQHVTEKPVMTQSEAKSEKQERPPIQPTPNLISGTHNRFSQSQRYTLMFFHFGTMSSHIPRCNKPRILYGLLSVSLLLSVTTAFASPPSVPNNNHHNRFSSSSSSSSSSSTALKSSDFSELTSQLARLDKQFQIEQRSKKAKSRWSKLMLKSDKGDEDEEEMEKEINLEDLNPEEEEAEAQNPEDFVWILEPPSSSIPSCVIVFTGGAGLGQFPHIAYNELLSRVSDRLNAVCIAAPYQVGLDHFYLAKQTGDRLRRALVHCQEDSSRQYPSNIPTYALTHSLGGKLQTIYVGATGQEYDGIGLMSFNNFSFGRTIGMARVFAEQIRKNTQKGQQPSVEDQSPMGSTEGILNTVFSFAETLVSGIGVDFTPNAKDTERLIQMRFDDVLQSKTRLFVFDEDNLDNSDEFVNNCSGGPGPSTSGLPGGHLTPVYFKLDVDELDLGDVPPEAREMAKEAMGGFKSASFGNEDGLNELVDEICNWILGKPPKRGPKWEAEARNEPPKLAGFPSDK
eukprot:scaffold1820_cov129-Cylindrotheca_fusiformis.AAC.16